jgi:hypothetical protein
LAVIVVRVRPAGSPRVKCKRVEGRGSRESRVESVERGGGLEGRLRRVDASAGPMQGVGGGMRRRDFVGDRRQG